MFLRRALSFAVVAIIASALGALASLSSAHADDETVILQDIAFNPSSVTINVGDTVTWAHNDPGQPHNVTSSGGGPLDSGNFEEGETFQFTFTEPGTFDYVCTIHAGMAGSVTVQQAASPTNTPAPDPTEAPAPTEPADDTPDTGDDDTPDTGDDDGTPAATSSPAAPESGTGAAGGGAPWGWFALAAIAVLLVAGAGGGAWIRARN